MARESEPTSRRLMLTIPGEKLLVPAMFTRERTLDMVEFHLFATAGDVKEKLDSAMVEWAAPTVVYSLLINGDQFWLHIPDEIRFHGGCAVVKTDHYFNSEYIDPLGYSEDPDGRTRERKMKKPCMVRPGMEGTPILKRYDTYGSVWSRRRYTLDNDDTFSFIQWMDSKTLKLEENPIPTRLEEVALHVKFLDESYRVMKNELSDIKDLMKSFNTLSEASLAFVQSLNQILGEQSATHTTLIEEMENLRRELRKN